MNSRERLTALMITLCALGCAGQPGATGSTGPEGPEGPAGQNGAPGSNGANGSFNGTTSGPAPVAGTGTISSTGMAVTGVGTHFTKLAPGDALLVGGSLAIIASIKDDLDLTLVAPFATPATNSVYSTQAAIAHFQTSGNQSALVMDPTGRLSWGPAQASGLQADQGGSIELGADNNRANAAGAVPYIDFHFGSGRAEDYNVRLINDADHHLSVKGDQAVSGQQSIGGGLSVAKDGSVGGTLGVSKDLNVTGQINGTTLGLTGGFSVATGTISSNEFVGGNLTVAGSISGTFPNSTGSQSFAVDALNDATLNACETSFGCGEYCGASMPCGITCARRWCSAVQGYVGGVAVECNGASWLIDCY